MGTIYLLYNDNNKYYIMSKVRKINEQSLRQIIRECVANVLKEEDGNSEFSKKFFQYAKDAKNKKVPNKSVEEYTKDEEEKKQKLSEEKLRSMIRGIVRESLNEIGDTCRGQYALGKLAARNRERAKQLSRKNNGFVLRPIDFDDDNYYFDNEDGWVKDYNDDDLKACGNYKKAEYRVSDYARQQREKEKNPHKRDLMGFWDNQGREDYGQYNRSYDARRDDKYWG